jgi:hypothetical protein
MAAEDRLGDGFRKLDDLVLHLKGLVLVRGLRQQCGADEGELLMYGAEIDRVRGQLATFARNGT